jgi:hypothetical protein
LRADASSGKEGVWATAKSVKVHATLVDAMPVNTTHADYDAALIQWSRARDVLAGEDAVKAGREKYLPRLDSQTDDDYRAYRDRAEFFNATARTAEGYSGLIFRRPPFVKIPDLGSAIGKAMHEFTSDMDMLGTSLFGYSKNTVSEVVAVGRAGTLIDWEGDFENRVYASLYTAEQIINWRVERVNGRNITTLVVLRECGTPKSPKGDDRFVREEVEQIRVLELVPDEGQRVDGGQVLRCVVEIWQPSRSSASHSTTSKVEWELVETRVPLRLGKALPLIPFVFHGPKHSRPGVDKLPLADIIAANLSHYRLNAEYRHGMHFTALPTAWVSGFKEDSPLRIGSSVVWTTDTVGATAGFLEFKGQGLETFERAMDRDEGLLAVLGSRLLEDQKKVGETAEAIRLRQSGESSILGSIATSVSESLTQVARWAYWWNSTEETPEDVKDSQVLVELNTDFSISGMSSNDLREIVKAWQAGAISQDTMLELFRKGEILPDGRSNSEEVALLNSKPKAADAGGEVVTS